MGLMTVAPEKGFFSPQQYLLSHDFFIFLKKIRFLRRGRNLVILHGPRHVNANICDAVAFLVTFSALPSEGT